MLSPSSRCILAPARVSEGIGGKRQSVAVLTLLQGADLVQITSPKAQLAIQREHPVAAARSSAGSQRESAARIAAVHR
jgi:hypothetical protein